MNLETRYLPFSARRYSVDCNGTVYNNVNKSVVRSFVDNGHVYVEIDWIYGNDMYYVALLMLVAFEITALPDYYLNQIEPLYKNNDCLDLRLNNILYRFKNGPIPVENKDGFYYIPFYERYCINKNGVVWSIISNSIMSWYITKPNRAKGSNGGYRACRAKISTNQTKLLLRHRALVLTFKRYDSNLDKLCVNHKNGVAGDDRLENLELVTYSQNNYHAFQLGLKKRHATPIKVLNVKTGEIRRFPTMQDCKRSFGNMNGLNLFYRLREAKNKLFPDNLIFRLDNGTPWPDISKLEKAKIHVVKDIYARNVFNNILYRFEDLNNAEAALGIGRKIIHVHAKERKTTPHKGFIFRFFEDRLKFPKYSKKHLEVFKDNPVKPPFGFIVYDNLKHTEMFFTSPKRAAKFFKITVNKVFALASKRARKKNILLNNRFSFKSFNVRENLEVSFNSNVES